MVTIDTGTLSLASVIISFISLIITISKATNNKYIIAAILFAWMIISLFAVYYIRVFSSPSFGGSGIADSGIGNTHLAGNDTISIDDTGNLSKANADDLRQAAQQWKDRTWPVGTDLSDLLSKYNNSHYIASNKQEEDDLTTLRGANINIISRKSGNLDNSIAVCVVADGNGNESNNRILAERIQSMIGRRRAMHEVCEEDDITIKVRVNSITFADSTTTIYASTTASWAYDDAPLFGFPVKKKSKATEQRLDGQERYTTADQAYADIGQKLADDTLDKISRH